MLRPHYGFARGRWGRVFWVQYYGCRFAAVGSRTKGFVSEPQFPRLGVGRPRRIRKVSVCPALGAPGGRGGCFLQAFLWKTRPAHRLQDRRGGSCPTPFQVLLQGHGANEPAEESPDASKSCPQHPGCACSVPGSGATGPEEACPPPPPGLRTGSRARSQRESEAEGGRGHVITEGRARAGA